MNHLKEYPNLYRLYVRIRNKWLIMALLFFLAFAFSFVSILWDLPEAVSVLTMAMVIPGVIALIVIPVTRAKVIKSAKRFTPQELARVDNDFPMAAKEEGYCVTRDALLHCGGYFFLYPVRDIIWVYRNVMTVRYLGIIPVSKSSSVMIGGRDHKRYGCKIKNRGRAMEFNETGLKQYRNGIFFGYSNELEKMFSKDFDRMLAISREYDMRNA